MHNRVADSSSYKSARRKLEEEVEASAKTIKKLKERQEALVAAPSRNDMSAPELHMKGERDKLWVSTRSVPYVVLNLGSSLTLCAANPSMFLL